MKVKIIKNQVKKNGSWVSFRKWLFNRFGLGPKDGINTNSGNNGVII
jgi:hypothetical protein